MTQLLITNDMLPPRYAVNAPGMPNELGHPGSAQYFYAYIPGGHTIFAARFSGTEVKTPARERSTVRAQIKIDRRTSWYGQDCYWILVEKIVAEP